MGRHVQLVARIEARAVARKASRDEASKRKARQGDARRKRAARAYPRREATKRDNRLRAELPMLDPHLRAVYDDAPATIKRLILEQSRDARMPFVRTGPSLDDVLAWKAS